MSARYHKHGSLRLAGKAFAMPARFMATEKTKFKAPPMVFIR
jgi:hypothetical protein